MPPNDVYLSPHHDDVCFSLGWTTLARPGGHLVNLFTLSNYTERELCARLRPLRIIGGVCRSALAIRLISRARAREDAAFAARCGLVRHDLGLRDALLKGCRTRDLANIQEDADRLGERLIDYLLALPPAADGRGRLYCPMGIGDHRDHVATLMAVLDALPRLRGRYSLLFYEDLHYASDAGVRAAGLTRFRQLCRTARPRRLVSEMTPGQFAEKLRLVALYASQRPRRPQASLYTPADGETVGPHEACWEIDGA